MSGIVIANSTLVQGKGRVMPQRKRAACEELQRAHFGLLLGEIKDVGEAHGRCMEQRSDACVAEWK